MVVVFGVQNTGVSPFWLFRLHGAGSRKVGNSSAGRGGFRGRNWDEVPIESDTLIFDEAAENFERGM